MKHVFLASVSIPLIAVFCGCVSCANDPDFVSVWGGDATPPTLDSVAVVSATRVSLAFSSPVTVISAAARLDDSIDGETVNGAGVFLEGSWTDGESAGTVFIDLVGPVPVGSRAVLDGVVEDAAGNSLSFAVPFTGFNEHPALLAINEVRFDYSKPKVEYIEFVAIRAGNLGGIEIVNARNENAPTRELPSVEVRAGDYITWHLRSVEEGLVNELGAVDVSGGIDANPAARDIWDTQTSAPLKPTNVILVRERRGGPIMDALLAAESTFTDWPGEALRAAAEEAVAAGAWPGALVADAVGTDTTSPTRTLGRIDGAALGPSRWAVCPTGKSSPGRENWVP